MTKTYMPLCQQQKYTLTSIKKNMNDSYYLNSPSRGIIQTVKFSALHHKILDDLEFSDADSSARMSQQFINTEQAARFKILAPGHFPTGRRILYFIPEDQQKGKFRTIAKCCMSLGQCWLNFLQRESVSWTFISQERGNVRPLNTNIVFFS